MNTLGLPYYLAALIGLGALVIGICATVRPLQMATKFGVSATESAKPYVMSTGIRDVFIGLTVLILFYRQEWVALGLIQFCISIVAISDFNVVRKYGDPKTSYVHLAGAVIVVLYGFWLLTR